MNKKKLYILIGKSGTGKTTLLDYMIDELNFGSIVSITTRPMRKGEIQGNPSYFVSEEEFFNTDKVQQSTYSGYFYGIAKKEILDKFEKYDNLAFVCNKEAVSQMKALNLFNIVVINIVVPIDETTKRMKERGDTDCDIEKRRQYDSTAFDGVNKLADYIIENIDLEDTKRRIKNIVTKK